MLALLLGLSIALPMYAEEAPTSQEATRPTYQITATGDIEIGPDGRVHRYELDKGQPAAIEQALARSIAQWRFEPVLVEGRPVIAATRMRISLSAEPRASGGYLLRVGGVGFGEPRPAPSGMIPPQYPREAMRAGIGAHVVMVIKLDDHGKAVRVHAEQVSLDRPLRNERLTEKWRKVFAEASADVASRWSFQVNETIDGKLVGATIRVPITYSLGEGGTSDNAWQGYLPGPVQPVPWPEEGAIAVERRQLKNGEVQSLSSRVRLTPGVVGSVL